MKFLFHRRWATLLFVTIAFSLTACGASRSMAVSPDGQRHETEGLASWYGERFHGRTTASGAPFDMYAFTAAHKTLPFGTKVRVVHGETKKSVVVTITDRGPFAEGRVIDLSYAAAKDLGMIEAGILPVELTILNW